MQVKVSPEWSSAGKDHQIDDGYMILNEVVEEVFLDGERVEPDTERYYEVERIENGSPEAIYLFKS